MSDRRMADGARPLRTQATVQRRARVTAMQRSAAGASTPSAAQALRRRLGNQASRSLAARSTAAPAKTTEAPVRTAVSPAVQLSRATGLPAKISKPSDPAELEAEDIARKVVRMPERPATAPTTSEKSDGSRVQRAAAATAPPPAVPAAASRVDGSGSPLPASVRSFMEPRFGASFDHVRIHTGEAAARQSADLDAHAFTVGEHVFFGRDRFQPQSASGRELIAHELTHTIQQGSAVQRSVDVTVKHRADARVQRSALGRVRRWLADKAANIPGFTAFTMVLGFNPITMAPVDRTAAKVLRELLKIVPGGSTVAAALDSHGIFERVGAWADRKLGDLKKIGGSIRHAVEKFIDDRGLSLLNPLSWDDAWDSAKRIFTEPIDRIKAFVVGLFADILRFVREAILVPLARFAERKRGYTLLKAVLGHDPITWQPVKPSAETLIGGFMELIGRQEVWENIKKAKAVERAMAWFRSVGSELSAFVRQIPMLFFDVLKALDFSDLILVPRAFAKVGAVFGGFVIDFIVWGGKAVWKLLEIIFEVVSPATLRYLRRTGAALRGILRNPVPFCRNLVRAAKLGFQSFARNFGTHLKAGLIDWLTGSLPGVYIPKAFTLAEVVKLVFSALGLTWQNVRPKLVRVIGETAVKVLETGFDVVVTLATKGPAAAWEKIQEHLSNLVDDVIGGIRSLVVDTIVKKAIPKLLSFFVPGAGFISAILSIYDTIMMFVRKLSQIAQVVTGFVDSIVAIAGGAVGAAASRVEKALAGVLSLAINFLAAFARLGNVSDKVMGVIKRARATVDKGIDALIAWIVKAAKGVFGAVKAGAKRLLEWWRKKLPVRGGGEAHTLSFEGGPKNARLVLRSQPMLPSAFLEITAKSKSIEEPRSRPRINETEKLEGAVIAVSRELQEIDEKPGRVAAGKSADLADRLARGLDAKMNTLAAHVGATLEEWGVGDVEIKKFDVPRPGGFTVTQKTAIAEQHEDKSQLRPDSRGRRISLGEKLDRRHIVSSDDMAKHYEDALGSKKLKLSQGKLLLEQRGSVESARTPVDKLSQAAIEKAARKRHRSFFGYVRNIFIGDSTENRRIQQHLDAGRPGMAKKELEEHVRHVKRAWALDDKIEITPVKPLD